jgi:hypothetical protein
VHAVGAGGDGHVHAVVDEETRPATRVSGEALHELRQSAGLEVRLANLNPVDAGVGGFRNLTLERIEFIVDSPRIRRKSLAIRDETDDGRPKLDHGC